MNHFHHTRPSQTFYYTKDIAFRAHEPVLKRLREHKAFAKKLSRALGRGEWGDAKHLEENKPVYRIDHIIKERCVRKLLLVDRRLTIKSGIRPSLMLSVISTTPSA